MPPPLPLGSRELSAFASSTESSAVPTDAPTCWLMFSVVLARATAARRSVCIAPEKMGIIEAPMPRPMTKRTAPKAQ